jgi:hypothetical protein
MVNGLKCYECALLDVCKVYTKLKPFTDEAKVDLGIELTVNDCKHYINENSEESAGENPETE